MSPYAGSLRGARAVEKGRAGGLQAGDLPLLPGSVPTGKEQHYNLTKVH